MHHDHLKRRGTRKNKTEKKKKKEHQEQLANPFEPIGGGDCYVEVCNKTADPKKESRPALRMSIVPVEHLGRKVLLWCFVSDQAVDCRCESYQEQTFVRNLGHRKAECFQDNGNKCCWCWHWADLKRAVGHLHLLQKYYEKRPVPQVTKPYG